MIQYQTETLTVFQSALYMTTSVVIETNDAIIMTDPNWLPHEIKAIRQFVDQKRRGRELYLLFTHSDFDHIIGYGAFPDATVIASEAFVHQPNKEKILKQIQSFDDEYYVKRDYPITYPAVDLIISNDRQQVKIGDTVLTFYLAPGHAEDSLFTVIEPYGYLIAGDYLSDVEFPFVDSNYEDYVRTLQKAETILTNDTITTLIPGHGHTTTSRHEMTTRLQHSQDYLAALATNSPAIEETLKKRYPFYNGMKRSHVNNLKMVQKKGESPHV